MVRNRRLIVATHVAPPLPGQSDNDSSAPPRHALGWPMRPPLIIECLIRNSPIRMNRVMPYVLGQPVDPGTPSSARSLDACRLNGSSGAAAPPHRCAPLLHKQFHFIPLQVSQEAQQGLDCLGGHFLGRSICRGGLTGRPVDGLQTGLEPGKRIGASLLCQATKTPANDRGLVKAMLPPFVALILFLSTAA
jgi:hypothetical protein